MSFGAAEMNYVRPMDRMPGDLSHEIRTPLAVIRMQAQLLLRTARRGAFAGSPEERDRLVHGLQRIDDAVTKLNAVLERISIGGHEAPPERPIRPDGHAGFDATQIH